MKTQKEYNINLEDRNFLQQLREKTREMVKTEGLNPDWRRVYQRFIDVANELDAYIARTEENPSQTPE